MLINMGYVWSIFSGAMPQIESQLPAIVKSGPVDDASRHGYKVQKVGHTAMIEMRGPMLKSAGWLMNYGFAGSVETEQALISAADDDSIESILWMIDSPGGCVDGLDSLYKTAKQINAEKPITVQVDGMLASAAMYVASAAGDIYANRRDLIGSIGARMMLYDYSEMFKEAGIKAIPIDTGEYKSAGAMGTEITEAQQAEFQKIVEGYFADFSAAVLEGRPISKESFDNLADGRVFFANEEPTDTGLISGIKSTREAIHGMLQAGDNVRSRRNAIARLKMLDIE